MIGARLKEFQQSEVERILSACTRCGKCYEVCPMTQYAKAPATPGVTGETVVPGVLAVLRGEPGSAAALGWIAVCTRSGVCVPACPHQVDPRMMMRLARMTALGGRGLPKQIEPQQDRDYFDRVRAFAKLQLTDEELKEWTE
jgi:L-lactate utilization protein LutB